MLYIASNTSSRDEQDCTSEFESSCEGNAPQSSTDDSASTQPNVSQYSWGQSLITAVSFSRALIVPHESSESLLTEEISHSTNVSSDEEMLPEGPLPSTQQLDDSASSLSEVSEPTNSVTQKVKYVSHCRHTHTWDVSTTNSCK